MPSTAPVFVARARNALITDVEGREYIDFAAGIGVMNVGHCHPKVVEAVKDQAELYSHTCFGLFGYESYLRLAEKLNQLTPGDFPKRTFFINSGAEAVENAVKIARYATGRKSIIAFEDAFHGRTYMTLSLTSQVSPYKVGLRALRVRDLPHPLRLLLPLPARPLLPGMRLRMRGTAGERLRQARERRRRGRGHRRAGAG